MLEALETLFKTVKDPVWILAFLAIIGLIYSNMLAWKQVKSRDTFIDTLHDCIGTHVRESTRTLQELTTLVEVMVYGRRGGGSGKH